jgi:hypothetical protein
VEGLVNRVVILILFLSISAFAKVKKYKFVSLSYFSKTYGHIHENPNNYSASVTTISCGYPIKIFSKKSLKDDTWKFVKVGGEYGYVRSDFLTQSRPRCLQAKYPKFFNKLNLDLSELYYWGRLNDQVLTETSHAN